MISRLSSLLFGSTSHYTNPIPLSKFEEYVEKGIRKDTLQAEFEMLNPADRQLKSWSVAKIQENRVKHRYYREPDSLLTYDHSRVVLEKTPGEKHSDFIAANWIDGYNSPGRYIGTQCPMPGTTNDFYRMVWQYGVQQIVNLTSSHDQEMGKCIKYFPDEECTFCDIHVKLLSMEETKDIIIRKYELNKEKETRRLTHFHCRTWPDHEVPESPEHLLNIIYKCRSDELYSKDKPILVHCVAGVGRTGTFILADSMLEMSRNEDNVDFLKHLWKIRNQRINMVARTEQYICAHRAIVAAQNSKRTNSKILQ
jgi:protein tyrosine phosphatase